MVNHPGEYNWSGYHSNVQDKPDTVMTPTLHGRLRSTKEEKQPTASCSPSLGLYYPARYPRGPESGVGVGKGRLKNESSRWRNGKHAPSFSGRPRMKEKFAHYYINDQGVY